MGRKAKSADPYNSITKRLDGLIRIMIETQIDAKDKKFNEAEAIRILNSIGLTQAEIAKIMGRKHTGSLSKAIYGSKKTKKSKTIPS